jgi:hypothetical protein
MRSDLRRISRIDPAAWARALDAAGATHRQLVWIAGAGGLGYLVEREKRYRALLEFLTRGGTWKEWREVVAAQPKIGRAATAAASREQAGKCAPCS